MKSTLAAINAIKTWLKHNDLDNDLHIYTRAEWSERRERYGTDADITITSEGGLQNLLNDISSADECEQLKKEFDELLTQLGFWYELGYSWTIHLYRHEATA